MPTTTYTLLCPHCPEGSQRGPERDTSEEAAADCHCDHPLVVIEAWTTHDDFEVIQDADGNVISKSPRRTVSESPAPRSDAQSKEADQ